MPDILIQNQRFYNPVDFVLQQIGGTWKAPILWRLNKKTLRYTELEKSIPHISQKMLTKTLKELETDGIISKKVFAKVPPHTEYSLTEKGIKIMAVITNIRDLGIELMKDAGIDYEQMKTAEKKLKASQR